MNITTDHHYPATDLKPEDEVPPSPSSSATTTSSSDLHHSSDNLEEDSPGTTPGAGSENGDPFTYQLPAVFPSAGTCGQEDKFILVTGGLGYIGSHTTLELLKQGYNVIAVDNLSNCFASTRWRIQHLADQHFQALAEQGCPVKKMPKLHFHKMDYQSNSMRLLLEQYSISPAAPTLDSELTLNEEDETTQSSEKRQSQISGVIHFAAYKSVGESITNPLAYYDNNVCGLVGFIRLLDEFNIHNFIFSSSATIYGSKANAEKPLREDQVLHFEGDGEQSVEGLTCAYARSKYFSEAILADLAVSAPSKWRITCLRYFNPVGCDPSGLLGESPRNTPTNLFPVVAEVLSGKRDKLSVFGTDWPTRDGTAIRDYVHVVDIARGHVAALASAPAPSSSSSRHHTKGGSELAKAFRTYNLGSGTGTSVLEIVESLSKAADRPVPIEWTGRRNGDVGFCVASTARAEKELGWFPRETIAQSARDLWNYITNRGQGQPQQAKKTEMVVVDVDVKKQAKVGVYGGHGEQQQQQKQQQQRQQQVPVAV